VRRCTILLGIVGLLGTLVPLDAAPRADSPALLIGRLARYADSFKAEFARIIGTEDYTQTLTKADGTTRSRLLLSEVFFFSGDQAGGAMTVRNVLQVDGRRQQPADGTIRDALSLPAAARVRKLKVLADLGARFNLGALQHNFSDPTLALMLASTGYRARFRFNVERIETIDGRPLHRITFREHDRPTLIRDARSGRDIPASGILWSDDDGVVWRTELRLDKGDTRAIVRASFRRDEKLQVMVPASMDESYRSKSPDGRGFESLAGHASYSNFRRFETAGRIVTP
jgi:hypothetical protein